MFWLCAMLILCVCVCVCVCVFQGPEPQDELREREPLYAKVNKQGSKRDLQLDGQDQPPGGADSWV